MERRTHVLGIDARQNVSPDVHPWEEDGLVDVLPKPTHLLVNFFVGLQPYHGVFETHRLIYASQRKSTEQAALAELTFPSTTNRNLMILDVNVNERFPHMVKDIVHIRLELKGPNVEELDGPAGPVHRDHVQLLPGF
jgi:hypothetical protein